MNKCPNCGARVYSNVRYCEYCRSEVTRPQTTYKYQSPYTSKVEKEYSKNSQSLSNINDDGSIIWGIIGFIFPIIGLIIYIVWYTSKPKNAQKAGLGALIGFIARVIGVSILPIFPFYRIFRMFPF